MWTRGALVAIDTEMVRSECIDADDKDVGAICGCDGVRAPDQELHEAEPVDPEHQSTPPSDRSTRWSIDAAIEMAIDPLGHLSGATCSPTP